MASSLMELPFDQYQRYKAVEEITAIIKGTLRKGGLRVLDVGGSPGLIADFLPHDYTLVLDPQPCAKPNYVRGDGNALPFADESFDLVTCLDTLEHIPREKREGFTEELFRVADDFVVITAPFADYNVQLAEQILYEFIRYVLKVEHEQLKEHIEYGLPRLGDSIEFLNRRGIVFIDLPSGYLYNWLIMMVIKHFFLSMPGLELAHRMIDEFYNLNFSEDDYKAPSYRHILVASKRGHEEVLEEIKSEFTSVGETTASENLLKLELFQALLNIINLKVANRIANLERELAMIKQGRFMRIFMRIMDRLYRIRGGIRWIHQHGLCFRR